MSHIALTPNTWRLVECVFTPEHRSAAVSLLEARCGSGLPLMREATPQTLERLRFAVLKLSQGSLDELARAIDVANTDWRDVLVAAGFANNLLAHQAWFNERTGA